LGLRTLSGKKRTNVTAKKIAIVDADVSEVVNDAILIVHARVAATINNFYSNCITTYPVATVYVF
jgi:H2-forming N5,N10-methylenetetrahydromethanopterin dehydrogenase-like enzyme